MHELHAILDQWHLGAPEAVLATVVHVQGSAYRRPGARMLILPDGCRIGSISGGCLEGEVAKKAWWFTDSGKPAVRVYDTSSDDDAVWEFGLGCNGVVHVLLERVDTPACQQAFAFLDRHRTGSTPAVIATVIRVGESAGDSEVGDNEAGNIEVGDRLFLDNSWKPEGSLAGSTQVLTHASVALREQKSRLVHLDHCDLFVEWVGPPLSLVILGAGHDAIPLAVIGKQLGWNVTVADGRPAYANANRFPCADRVVLLPPSDPFKNLAIDSRSAVVMMTHNYPLDRKLLPALLEARPRYLGILGPKSRAERLFEEIGRKRIPHAVHAPVGMDLGSDNPLAIAIAIAGEILAVLAGRTGGMLKHREEAIHPPVAELGVAPRVRPAIRPSFCETTVDADSCHDRVHEST